MEQATDKKLSLRPRGSKAGRLILERLCTRALRRFGLLADEHWAWTPPGHMAKFYGPAHHVTAD